MLDNQKITIFIKTRYKNNKMTTPTTKITFDESAKKDILNFLGKDTNDEGFIVEKDNPGQKVLTIEGEEIHINELGGIKKGSELFIKNDLVSLMRLSKK